MKKILLFLPLFVFLSLSYQPIKAQLQVTKAIQSVKNFDSTQLTIQKYYHLALAYKDGKGVAMDYSKAYGYFQQAAELGDSQSVYAVAYMHYKGLGCTQDYELAAKLFAQGAYGNRNNSMYFYGLCWRNGYGVAQNKDSASYWLKKSAALGYTQAVAELKMPTPENSNNSATALARRIQSAAVPDKVPLNQFYKVTPHLPADSVIAGSYSGYLIRYDWSGRYPISSKKLQLVLNLTKGKGSAITGRWLEDSIAPVSIEASLSKDSLEFESTAYKRKDHYSHDSAINYEFKNAALNIVRKGDSVYLAGNIYMFSPDRKEPSKPLFIALTRATVTNTDSSTIKKQYTGLTDSSNQTAAAKLLSVYPNPFDSYVNVQFRVNRSGNVGIELYNVAGVEVYRKPSQALGIGTYTILVEPSNQLPTQTYLLRLVFANGQEAVNVIKK